MTPKEIVTGTIEIGIKKVKTKPLNQFILGILAGAFIAFASEGSNMAAFNLFAKPETYGLGKASWSSLQQADASYNSRRRAFYRKYSNNYWGDVRKN